MDGQRTPATDKSKTVHIHAPREAAQSEQQAAPLFEHSQAVFAAANGGRPLPPSTPENILWLQRTIGNRAVGRFLNASLQQGQSAIGRQRLGLAADVSSEEKELPRDKAKHKEQQESRASMIQTKLLGSTSTQVTWGQEKNSHNGGPAWGSQIDSESDKKTSHGTSAGLAEPRPVSWGAMQATSGDRNPQTGTAVSGPPAGTDLLTVQGHAGMNMAVGWTFFPTAFRAPEFEFKETNKWFAKPTLKTTAFEGNADAFFVTPGKHKTQFQEGGKDVFWRFTGAMSNRDRIAEQEHCNDHKHAYKISLKEAETVLKKHIVGKTFGPKDTKAAVQQMVLDRITAKLTHPQLGNDQTVWAAKYDMLFRKTGDRDTKGWHTFGLANRTVDPVTAEVTYKIVKGTTKVGVVGPGQIVKY